MAMVISRPEQESPRAPDAWVTGGYDVHVVYDPEQQAEATALFDAFVQFVTEQQIPHQRPRVFERPVGPWPTPMWQVLLRNPDGDRLYADLGRCTAWLMLNRGALSVMIHPNTTAAEGRGGAVEDHRDGVLWMGPSMPLRLEKLG